MGEVRLISTSLIQPTSCRHEQYSILDRIDLTPWDLPFIWVGPIQKGLLFSKPIPSGSGSGSDSHFHQTDNFSVDRLKTSFSRTLEFFPLLAARFSAVKNHDDTTSFFIDCKVNAGAEFVHAVADHLTVADVVQPKYVPRVVHSFFPLNGVKNHEGTSKPLLAVQVTELADGYFIGCSMNHTVGDGSSFWHFINSWSEIARGSGTISRPPVLQRWFPDDDDDDDTLCPIRLRLREEQLSHHLAPSPYEERIFHITRAKIAELKSRANSEMGVSNLSSLQSLMAHLWRSIARCQRLCPDEQTRCLIVVGARPRLRPPLPENYYGNAVKFTIVTAAAGELLEEGLGWAATKINAEIASFTDEEIRKSYRSWGERPEPIMLGASFKNGLALSSSPRFDMYGNDFGWGAPVAVRSGMANKNPGKVTVFEGKEEGSIDLEACLSPETMRALEDDAEFMEVFS